MAIEDLLKQILLNFWRHKIRTCFALFGIIWGTIAVILLLSLGHGFYQASIKNLAFINNGTIFIWPGTTSKPYAGLAPGQNIHVRMNDMIEVMNHIPNVQRYSPNYFSAKEISYQNKHLQAAVQGVSSDFKEIQQISVESNGRFINQLDMIEKRRVVFLDEQVKLTLFGKQEAIGKFIFIQGVPFVVIGTTDTRHKGMMMWMTNMMYIPYTTYLSLFGDQDIRLLFVQPALAEYSGHIKYSINNILAVKNRFDPSDTEALHFAKTEHVQLFFKWFFRILELFLGGAGALTLSVGGLSIANMMFLIVTERTREIGLRMALGAKPHQILLQFMLETWILVALGGIIGFLGAISFLSLLQYSSLPSWLGTPSISSLTTIATIFILFIVGTLAGYFPAHRAANMEPVKALAF